MRRPRLAARLATLAAFGAAALGAVGCGGGGAAATAPARPRAPVAVAPAVEAQRGRLVSVRRVGAVTRAQARALLRDAGLPSDRVRRGATAYAVVYVTIDPDGERTQASGLVAFPRGDDGPLPVVAYHHGTVFAPQDAPSLLDSDGGAPAAAFFATAGFAYAAPDYLGLGRGRGDHPYLHASSEATASLDLLRAMRPLAARQGITLATDVYATGFSQGGQATMALAELLSAEPDGALRLRAVAPIAGPLDLSGATWAALFADAAQPGHEMVARYLAKALLAWDRIYGLFDDPADVFAARYASTIADLVERGADAAPTPPSVAGLLRADALERLRVPDGALARALRDNDSCRRPVDGAIRIYQGDDDGIVVPENAHRCQQLLAEHGIDAEVVELPGVGHGDAARAALPLVAAWFARLAESGLSG